jgi:glucosamine 6-phosphate synthetase-like amidotransferase/phosphosugar isomerase protein
MCGIIVAVTESAIESVLEGLGRLGYRGYDYSGISMQLLALYSAQILGKNIDQPRNLAQSVTVE